MGAQAAKRAEKKASNAQQVELILAQQAQDAENAALEVEQQRIFDATKPMEQVAQAQYGLGEREGSSYSSFEGGVDNIAGVGEGATPDLNATGGGLLTKEEEEKAAAPKSPDIWEEYFSNPWYNSLSMKDYAKFSDLASQGVTYESYNATQPKLYDDDASVWNTSAWGLA